MNFRILLYHGVYDDKLQLNGRNSSGKHIKASTFKKQISFLSKNKRVITMENIKDAYDGKFSIDKNSVAITFDDGFLNNYKFAWPILKQYNIPATFYLSTGFISKKKRIWTDLLENLILTSKKEHIKFNLKNKSYEFLINNQDKKIKAFAKIKEILKKINYKEKNNLMDKLLNNIEHEDSCEFDLYNFMKWEHIKEMNKSSLISFGAHTVDHVSLTSVSKKEAKNQIINSIGSLSSKINENVKLFSYPEGQKEDFDKSIINILKSIKINHCPTAIHGVNNFKKADPYYLKRIMVGFSKFKYPFKIN